MNRLLQILITLSLPLLFLTGTVQALLPNGTLLRFEYTRPGFLRRFTAPEMFAGVRLWTPRTPGVRLRYAGVAGRRGSARLAALRQRTGDRCTAPGSRAGRRSACSAPHSPS
jgi:hypothetical protein